jgi:hypothetical protein
MVHAKGAERQGYILETWWLHCGLVRSTNRPSRCAWKGIWKGRLAAALVHFVLVQLIFCQ